MLTHERIHQKTPLMHLVEMEGTNTTTWVGRGGCDRSCSSRFGKIMRITLTIEGNQHKTKWHIACGPTAKETSNHQLVHASMCIYDLRRYIKIYVCMSVCLYLFMYLFMCVCTYVRTNVQTACLLRVCLHNLGALVLSHPRTANRCWVCDLHRHPVYHCMAVLFCWLLTIDSHTLSIDKQLLSTVKQWLIIH